MNFLMFADDIVLCSASLKDLELLVNMCSKAFDDIGMTINAKKSACLRIGNRHNSSVKSIILNNVEIEWKQEIRYLGVFITSSKSFTINLQYARKKFFKCLNGIFGQIGLKTSPTVLMTLIESNCVSILLYACEAVN